MDNSTIIIYPAIIKLEDEIYSVCFPDLDGCFSQGNTIEEAFINSQEALAIYYYEKMGELPEASSIEKLKPSSSFEIVQMIPVDLKSYMLKKTTTKFVRKNLTIPDWLHDLSQNYNINYSNVLKEALIERLKNNSEVSKYDKMLLND